MYVQYISYTKHIFECVSLTYWNGKERRQSKSEDGFESLV